MKEQNTCMDDQDIRSLFINGITATPFSEMGIKSLSELGFDIKPQNLKKYKEEFFDNVYCEPFDMGDSYDSYDDDDDDDNGDSKENIPVFTRSLEYIENQRGRKNAFERNVTDSAYEIFMITGTAGSGKTTYLNWLFEKYIKFNEKFTKAGLLLLDIENSDEVDQLVKVCGESYDLKKEFYSSLHGRIFSIFLFKISQQIMQKHEELPDYKRRLEVLVSSYNSFFIENETGDDYIPPAELPYVKNFFNIIKKFINDENESYISFSKQLKVYIDSIREESDVGEQIKWLFAILLKVIICTNLNTNKKAIIAVDNIERLIEENSKALEENTKECEQIPEHDLENVIMAFKEAIASVDKIIKKAKGHTIREHLIVILSVRETTVDLFNNVHLSDYEKSFINITHWFDAKKIYDLKYKAYLERAKFEKLEKSNIYKIFKTILKDNKNENAGLYHVIKRMYNHNMRRIPLIFSRIMDNNSNVEIANEYLKLWEESLNPKDNMSKTALRHLCRKAILRLFYNYFDFKGLYKSLKVVNEEDGKLPNNSCIRKVPNTLHVSYVRRILTFLYQKKPFDKKDELQNYIKLSEMVNNAIKPVRFPNIKLMDDDIFETLSEILLLMLDTKMYPYDWAPLIEIIIGNDKKLTKPNIKIALRESEKHDEYLIKITDAGREYARFNTDFEYFASRYCERRSPLISTEHLKQDKSSNEYRCLELIREVREKTFQCIEKLIKNDLDFFYVFNRTQEHIYKLMKERHQLFLNKLHPVRLIQHHRGYLEKYKEYIRIVDILDDVNKKRIIADIENEINKYEEDLRKICSKYKNYFSTNISSQNSY